MNSSFFAYLNRMKYIKRWSLMRNTVDENVMEHSFEVAAIAELLAVVNRRVCKGDVSIEKVLSLALYHDMSEVLTGDMPTPAKYFSDDIRRGYKEYESKASQALVEMLPDEIKDYYVAAIIPDENSYEYKLVKAADKLSALVKCMEETASGNNEFKKAMTSIKNEVNSKYITMPEVGYFLENFLSAYAKSLDEL